MLEPGSVFLTIGMVAVLVIAYLIGYEIKEDHIKDYCQDFKKVELHKQWYTCTKVALGEED